MRIVVLSTPTSATGSLWRIVTSLAPSNLDKTPFIDQCIEQGLTFEQISTETLPRQGCFLFNQPHLFNFDQDLASTKFIINFRDPRDLSCNQYHWTFVHPSDLTEEKKLRVKERGIDEFVLSLNHRPLYRSHRLFSENMLARRESVVTSYVQLCFAVPTVVERIAKLLSCDDAGLVEAVTEREHPSSLAQNRAWVGNYWANSGADVFPGRARIELKISTFEALTDRYRAELTLLGDLDESKYRFFYE